MLKIRPYQRCFALTWRICFLQLYQQRSWSIKLQTSLGLVKAAVLKMIFVLVAINKLPSGLKLSQQNTCLVGLSFAVLCRCLVSWEENTQTHAWCTWLVINPFISRGQTDPCQWLEGLCVLRVFLSLWRLSLDWPLETWFSRKENFGLTASS